jgi:AcrR family transcriptional regulator
LGGKGARAAGRNPRAAATDVAARERLSASATALFNRKGYSATTVREIVADAGVTKPVLYYYFRNKEGIFLDLMREAWAHFESLLDAVAEGPGSARQRLVRLADRTFALFMEHIGVARLMYAVYYGPPQGAPFFDFDRFHQRFQSSVRRMVEEGIRAGEFRRGNADDMTWAFIGAVNVAMELQLCHPERGLGAEGLARVLDVIFTGMAREAAGGRPAGRNAKEGRR